MANADQKSSRPESQPENGGGGIRTRERAKPSTGFQDRRIQPLCHPTRVHRIAKRYGMDMRGDDATAPGVVVGRPSRGPNKTLRGSPGVSVCPLAGASIFITSGGLIDDPDFGGNTRMRRQPPHRWLPVSASCCQMFDGAGRARLGGAFRPSAPPGRRGSVPAAASS